MPTALLLVAASTAFAQSAQPLTVCEILQNRSMYDGRVVTIQSHITGTMEGEWLDSDACSGAVKEDDYTWGTMISLENAFTAAKIHPIDFEEDQRSAARVEEKYRKLRRRSPLYLWLRPRVPGQCIEFILTGQFGTRREFSKMTYRDGSFLYIGFGHGGQAPAQLVIKSTEDVVVRPGCR